MPKMLQRGERWWLVAMMLVMCGHVSALAAQVNYNIFPATASQSSGEASQPTDHVPQVTLDVHDSTIAYVVLALIQQAHLQPYFDNHNPVFAKRITVHVAKMGIMDALAIALKGTGLEAKLTPDGETAVIRSVMGLSPKGRTRLTGVIIGHVTDSASGMGLQGASVQVGGTKLSTVTSDSGHFTLRDVPSGDQVLIVKLFGYKPAARTVTVADSDRKTVRIVLIPIPTVISGVVTTATGLQRKVEIGNDITTLNADSIMQHAPITSVTDLLDGRVPGLTVDHSSGVPGAPSRLRLRGAGSAILNNDPVVIVDGIRVYSSQSDPRNANLAPGSNQVNVRGSTTINPVNGEAAIPSPLDQIDPASIETIDVFKGPSASALYGSDAAAGVIVITTKHGKAGPTHWTLGVGEGVNWIPGTWPTNDFRFGHYTLNDGNKQPVGFGGVNTWIGGSDPGLCLWEVVSCTIDSVVQFQALNDPRYTVFTHGQNQTANLSVNGGVSAITYNLTGSTAGDAGNLKLPEIEQRRYTQFYGPVPGWMIHPDKYSTYGVTGQLTVQPTPTAHVTLSSSLYNSNQQQGSLQSGISQLAGAYVVSDSLSSTPLIVGEVQQVTDHQLTSTNAVTLDWRIKPWLPLTVTGGINTVQRTDVSYIPYGIHQDGNEYSTGQDTTGQYGLGRGTSQNNTVSIGTTIPLSPLHMTLAVGGNAYDQSTADFSALTNQLGPGVSSPSVFSTDGCNQGGDVGNCSSFGQNTSATSTYGYYVEPRLNFASRFFVAPGFRFDGGSGGSHATYSGSGVSSGGVSAFPKIDFSYLAVDRPTGRPLWGVLTQLRPRVAFGLAGTQPGLADRLRYFNVGVNNFQQDIPGGVGTQVVDGVDCKSQFSLDGTTMVSGVCLSSLGNTQLRPERSSELEGGFDAELWHGRVSMTYSQYHKLRREAILSIPVAPSVVSISSALTAIEKNVGDILNTGTEGTLNVMLVENQRVSWNMGATLSHNNNLVTRLDPGIGAINFGNGTRLVVGYPLFGLWERPIVAFADANQNGIIEPSEIRQADSSVYVGQPSPKYELNLNTGVTLFRGRLSVNATFAYQNGMTQNNIGALNSGSFLLLPNNPNTPLATEAAIAAAYCPGACSANYIGLAQTVNTFRFNDVSLNYVMPQIFATWVHASHLTLAVQGSNLALHSNYRGKDPNVNAFSTVSAGDQTADTGQIPEPRTWWLKMTVGN